MPSQTSNMYPSLSAGAFFQLGSLPSGLDTTDPDGSEPSLKTLKANFLKMFKNRDGQNWNEENNNILLAFPKFTNVHFRVLS